jgi:hypothetical protein
MMTFLLVLVGLSLAPSSPVPRCSIRELRAAPGYAWSAQRIAQMVDSAAEIVRARAVSADSLAHRVTFEPLEWIRRATDDTSRIELYGTVVDRDDFNRMVRPAGQRGDCFATEYRLGAEYLLLFTDRPRPRTIQWWGLAPLNEQLRGDDDPWLLWVRARAASHDAVRHGASTDR